MKFTATLLVSAMTLSTGLASVIYPMPLQPRSLPDSGALLRRHPLEEMDPLDALRLVLLRRAAAGAPPPPAGGDKKAAPKGDAGKAGGDKAAAPKGDAGKAGGDKAGADKGGAKPAAKKDDPWVPPEIKGRVHENNWKCNVKTESCSGELVPY